MKKLIALGLLLGLVCVPLAHGETKKEKKARKAAKKEVAASATAAPTTSNASKNQKQKAQKAEVAPSNKAAKKEAKKNRDTVKAENQRINRKVDKAVKRDWKYNNERLSFNDARAHFVRTRHDRGWWNSHYSRFTLYGGGYWYWNNGWWYPAYGYNPGYNSYMYDGPVYGYGYANPGDMTVRVQRALAQRGFYYGPIDGTIGPMTRNAIRQYQIAAGLAVTSVMDEPTLATLRLV